MTLTGYKESTHHRLLDLELANNIRNLIPARFQLFDNWELVYSLEQHGISLNTLYRNSNPEHQLRLLKTEQQKGFADSIVKNMVVGDTSRPRYSFEPKRSQSYVLVIKDNHNNKFGAYLSENLKPMEHRRYYGNGECFLWKCEKYDPSKLDHAVDKRQLKKSDLKHLCIPGSMIILFIPITISLPLVHLMVKMDYLLTSHYYLGLVIVVILLEMKY